MTEHIEAFNEDHLDDCAHLLVATFNAEPWNDNWTLDTAKQEIAWTMKVPGFVGLISLDEEVVAFATGWREPDDVRKVFYLKTFCVRPDAQGTGVGSRLIAHLKEHLGSKGVAEVEEDHRVPQLFEGFAVVILGDSSEIHRRMFSWSVS